MLLSPRRLQDYIIQFSRPVDNSDVLSGGTGGAVSGLCSMTKRTKPFVDFLAGRLVTHRVQSLVETSMRALANGLASRHGVASP